MRQRSSSSKAERHRQKERVREKCPGSDAPDPLALHVDNPPTESLLVLDVEAGEGEAKFESPAPEIVTHVTDPDTRWHPELVQVDRSLVF